MSIWEAIVLGIVQGTTEFVPISSSGHLILVPWLFGWSEPGLTFNVGVHIGTLAAVVIYFWRDLFAMTVALPKGIAARQPLTDPMSFLAVIIIIGSIPAALVGLTLGDRIEEFFHSGAGGNLAIGLIAVALMLVAVMMFLGERLAEHRRPMEEIRVRDGIIIGIAQSVALFPGVSRSGSTITAGLFLGFRRETAARFSFLLGIPAVVGASAIEVRRFLTNGLADGETSVLAVGIITSGVVGYLSIAFLLRFLARHSTAVFILYRIAFGALVLALLAFGLR